MRGPGWSEHARRRRTASSFADTPLVVYERELDYIFATFERLGAGPREVEELAQQLFVALHQSWPTRDVTFPVRLGLFGMAFRLMWQRRRRGGEPASGDPERPPLLRQLERMPLRRRAALVMRDLDGFSIADIAAILSTSRFGVRLRLRRARKQIAAALRRTSAENAWACAPAGG